jgi:hypothetical protein
MRCLLFLLAFATTLHAWPANSPYISVDWPITRSSQSLSTENASTYPCGGRPISTSDQKKNLFPLINGSALAIGFHLNPDMRDQNLWHKSTTSVGMLNGDENGAFLTVNKAEYELTSPGLPEFNGTKYFQVCLLKERSLLYV